MKRTRILLASLIAAALAVPVLQNPGLCQSNLSGKRIQPATLPATALSATGTPSSTTFLRGDWTWATPAAAAAPTLYCVTPAGTVDGSNMIFTLPATPLNGTAIVFLRGLLQPPGAAYTLNGRTLTFANSTGYAGPKSGNYLYVIYNN